MTRRPTSVQTAENDCIMRTEALSVPASASSLGAEINKDQTVTRRPTSVHSAENDCVLLSVNFI